MNASMAARSELPAGRGGKPPQFCRIRPDFSFTTGFLNKKTLQMLKRRRKHLDLIRMRFPLLVMVPGIRRVRPAGLFLFIPILLWLQRNVATPQSIQTFKPELSSPLLQPALLGLLWKSTV